MLGEDVPELKLYKKYIRGLTKEEVNKIKKIRKNVVIKEGVRYIRCCLSINFVVHFVLR